jgi:hypothetical protein
LYLYFEPPFQLHLHLLVSKVYSEDPFKRQRRLSSSPYNNHPVLSPTLEPAQSPRASKPRAAVHLPASDHTCTLDSMFILLLTKASCCFLNLEHFPLRNHLTVPSLGLSILSLPCFEMPQRTYHSHPFICFIFHQSSSTTKLEPKTNCPYFLLLLPEVLVCLCNAVCSVVRTLRFVSITRACVQTA